MMGFAAGLPWEVQNEVGGWLEKYRMRQEQGQLGGRSLMKKELGTKLTTQLTPCDQGEHVPARAEWALAHKCTATAATTAPIVKFLGKHRVHDSPIGGSWDPWDAVEPWTGLNAAPSWACFGGRWAPSWWLSSLVRFWKCRFGQEPP